MFANRPRFDNIATACFRFANKDAAPWPGPTRIVSPTVVRPAAPVATGHSSRPRFRCRSGGTIRWLLLFRARTSPSDASPEREAGFPDPHLFIRSFVRREAVLSSRIEGTRTTLAELLAAEAGAKGAADSADLREVVNCAAALDAPLESLCQTSWIDLPWPRRTWVMFEVRHLDTEPHQGGQIVNECSAYFGLDVSRGLPRLSYISGVMTPKEDPEVQEIDGNARIRQDGCGCSRGDTAMGGRFRSVIWHVAVIGFAGLFALPASARSALYPYHVKCNEAYRASPAHSEQKCVMKRVNHDHFTYRPKRSKCYVDIRCWAWTPSVHPHLPEEWVVFKGVFDIDYVRQIRLCYSENAVRVNCRIRN